MGKVIIPYPEGYVGKSVCGQEFKVICYSGRKNITIKFNCGYVRNTTSTHIKRDKVLYKKVGLVSLGSLLNHPKGGDCIVTDYTSDSNLEVTFGSGYSCKTSRNNVIKGKCSYKPKNLVKVGDKFTTNNYGDCTVIKYNSATDIEVVFTDGSVTSAHATCLRSGSVSHPTYGMLLGYKFTNSDGCVGEVVEIVSEKEVSIKWFDGVITKNHRMGMIRRSSIYYPNARTVVGVGYFGIGKYKPNKSGKNINYNPVVFRKWQHMISRCYNESEQKKPSCRAYIGVDVCDEWHNFQNFALWAEDKLDKFVDGFELDKDMFGTGDTYLPEYCTLLPDKVNGFLSDNYSSKSSGLPDGVNVIKPNPKFPKAKIGYCARCHIDGKRVYLGYYNTPEEAGSAYRDAKEKEARRLAEEYKGVLSEREYLKLKSFTLEDIHRKQGTS